MKRRQRLMSAARRWHRQHAVAACLLKDEACAGPIVRAHTVQNARGLDCIARDGHVYMIEPDPKLPASRFERVGRSEATTFTGFCGYHDAAVFREIDEPWDPAKEARLVALHAMRAAAREYWAKLNVIESFAIVLGNYRRGDLGAVAAHLGVGEEDVPPDMANFWHQIVLSHRSGAKRMEARFWGLYSQVGKNDFHLTSYWIHVLDGEPRAGAAIWGTPEFDFYDQRISVLRATGYLPDVAMCVIPEPSRTLVILAHHRRDRKVVGRLLSQLDAMSDVDRRYFLSWFLVIHGENVVFAPDYIDALDPRIKGRIEETFHRTILDAMSYAGLPRIDFFS